MTGNETRVTRELIWEDDNVLRIDDVTFILMTGKNLYTAASREQTFIIGKSRNQLEALLGLPFGKPVERIFDLGIYKGGSVMFYHKLFAPEKIVAVDLNPAPVEPLDAYVREHKLEQRIRTYHGVDQADEEKMEKILNDEAQGLLFDLVVDDASHFLRETRASFNMLFPRLAPGGFYIIEDWGWAHWDRELWQKNGGPWPNDPPLSNLVFELTMLLASRPDLIESIYLLPSYAVVKRGLGQLDPELGRFDLSGSYLNRGKAVQLLD